MTDEFRVEISHSSSLCSCARDNFVFLISDVFPLGLPLLHVPLWPFPKEGNDLSLRRTAYEWRRDRNAGTEDMVR